MCSVYKTYQFTASLPPFNLMFSHLIRHSVALCVCVWWVYVCVCDGLGVVNNVKEPERGHNHNHTMRTPNRIWTSAHRVIMVRWWNYNCQSDLCPLHAYLYMSYILRAFDLLVFSAGLVGWRVGWCWGRLWIKQPGYISHAISYAAERLCADVNQIFHAFTKGMINHNNNKLLSLIRQTLS